MKKHWYLYSFSTDALRFKNVYVGQHNKEITMKDINFAGRKSPPSLGKSILISVSYLGYMTQDEFHNMDL